MKISRHWGFGNGRRKSDGKFYPLSIPDFQLPAHCLQMAVFFLCMLSLSIATARGAERDGRWAILIAGISGDPDLQQEYLKEFADLRSILEGPLGFPRDQVVVLFDDPSKRPEMVQHKSTRENVQAVCRDFAGRVQPDDLVFVFIEGHGDYDGKTYKLNLVGPDPTGEELASMLFSIPARRFAIVNATNCSGGSISALSRPGAIILAATKSGMEKNRTRLGRYFIDGLQNNSADSDKNGRISMIEAFSFARQSVEEYYASEGSMQTEHPVLEDTGDGMAQSSPAPENGEGLLARAFFLDNRIPLDADAKRTPEQQKLVREARDLEMQIDALKYAKNEMPELEYEKQLEALLLRLAQINAKLPR